MSKKLNEPSEGSLVSQDSMKILILGAGFGGLFTTLALSQYPWSRSHRVAPHSAPADPLRPRDALRVQLSRRAGKEPATDRSSCLAGPPKVCLVSRVSAEYGFKSTVRTLL